MENAVQICKKFFENVRNNPNTATRTATEFGMVIKFHSNEVKGKGKVTAFSARHKENGNGFIVTELDFDSNYEVLLYLNDKVEIVHDEPFFEMIEDMKPSLAFFKDFTKVLEINKNL